jgi:hypothetical protein
MEDGGKLVTEELMFYFLTAGTIHSEVCFPGDRFKRRGLHISFSGDFSLHGSNTYVAMKAIVRSIQSTRRKNLLALRYEKGKRCKKKCSSPTNGQKNCSDTGNRTRV